MASSLNKTKDYVHYWTLALHKPAHFMNHAMTPRADYVPYTDAQIQAIKRAGVITDAARWDCASLEQRMVMNPKLNPNKRWFEQKAWKLL